MEYESKALEAAFQKYGDKVKATLVVHLYSLSHEIEKIMEICNKYDVPVIEDSVESLCAYYKGRHVGIYGKFGVFSLHEDKFYTEQYKAKTA